jgi:hypothetical protein
MKYLPLILLATLTFFLLHCEKDSCQITTNGICRNDTLRPGGFVDNVFNLPIFSLPSVTGATGYRLQVAIDTFFVTNQGSNSTVMLDSTFSNHIINFPLFPQSNSPNIQYNYGLGSQANFYWRYAVITNGVQGSWFGIFNFRTMDIRNALIGNKAVQKYFYWKSHPVDGYCPSSICTTYVSTSEIQISKGIGTSIDITEMPVGTTINYLLSRGGLDAAYQHNHGFFGQVDPYSYVTFNCTKDSFEIQYDCTINRYYNYGTLFKGANPLKR